MRIMKDIKMTIHVDVTEIDSLIAKLKEANSLADELASKKPVQECCITTNTNLSKEISKSFKKQFN